MTAFTRLVWKLSALAAGLGVLLVGGTILLGPTFLPIYGPGYAAHQQAFVVLSVGTAIQLIASCWGYALTAARSLRIQIPIVLIASSITTGASLLLIPRWGVRGAAFTSIATSLSMLLFFSAATIAAARRRRRELLDKDCTVKQTGSPDAADDDRPSSVGRMT